jgi:DNA polymerase-3 subunit chi
MDEKACEVWFYHLERSTLDAVVPELLERTLAKGWRALVRASSQEMLEHLDRWLWAYRDDSFLAHGLEGEPAAARQPVLLTLGAENTNEAQALVLIEGAKATDLSAFERCMVIFDGRDDGAVVEARRAWAEFKQAGHDAAYWRQGENRGWVKQGA